MEDEKKVEETTEETSTEESPKSVQTEGGSKKSILAIVIVAFLIIGALEISGTINLFGGGKAVARINGEKITQAEFDERLSQILASPQAQSLQLDDPSFRAQIEEQVLTEMINTRLLLQTALDAGHTATEEEVDGEYNLIVERLGSEEVLAEELARGGLTASEFRSNVRDQIIIQKLLEENIGLEQLAPTDEEVDAFYESISDQEGIPPLEDIRSQIEGQLAAQREQELVGGYIAELRTNANIELLNE